MTITLIRPTASNTGRSDLRPVAVALHASVEAVRDSLAHMEPDAVLSVPIGTPHQNFDIVEWCARNDKPVINRFDPWPLEHLLVQNKIGNTAAAA